MTTDTIRPLDYHASDQPWVSRRWLTAMAGISVGVGLIGIGFQGLDHLKWAWIYVFHPGRVSMPPTKALAMINLPIAVALAAELVLLVVAGCTSRTRSRCCRSRSRWHSWPPRS